MACVGAVIDSREKTSAVHIVRTVRDHLRKVGSNNKHFIAVINEKKGNFKNHRSNTLSFLKEKAIFGLICT